MKIFKIFYQNQYQESMSIVIEANYESEAINLF